MKKFYFDDRIDYKANTNLKLKTYVCMRMVLKLQRTMFTSKVYSFQHVGRVECGSYCSYMKGDYSQ